MLSVLAYHAGSRFVPGGFVGVDVFFVISGYLITLVILQGLADGSFSFQGFYLRRAKRILPALFLVMAATLLAGLVLLTPDELKALGKSLSAAGASASNILFWRESGYFDIASELKPLLHTWSLGVEEQFYLIWPTLLLLVWHHRLHRFALPASLALLAGLFSISYFGTLRAPSATFFLLPTRAWELMLGAMLAQGQFTQGTDPAAPPQWRAWIHDGAALVGIAMIAVAVFGFDRETVFPGVAALLPTVGAALLIAADSGNVVNRWLLATRPMVFVGLISYSLYLWHWPLLSFARILTLGELDDAMALGLLAASFGLATATWRYVEIPFRTAVSPAPRRALLQYGAVSLLAIFAGLACLLDDGLSLRVDRAVVQAEAIRHEPGIKERWNWRGTSPGNALELAGVAPHTAVWGDSHAEHYGEIVLDITQGQRGLTYISSAGCAPVAGNGQTGAGVPPLTRGCLEHNAAILQRLLDASDIRTVVLAARWGQYLKPEPSAFLAGLGHTVRRLAEGGKRVVFAGQVPTLAQPLPACLARRQMWTGATVDCARVAPGEMAMAAAALSAMRDLRQALPAELANRFCVFDPPQTCSKGICAVVQAGILMYRDANHLSHAGATAAARQIGATDCFRTWILDRP